MGGVCCPKSGVIIKKRAVEDYNSMDAIIAKPGDKRAREGKLSGDDTGDGRASNGQHQEFQKRKYETIVPVIKLTVDEQKMFDFLKEMHREKGLNTTMRVAGGWVRDKCLGKDSDDIDISVDDMTGEDFAKNVVDQLKKKGYPIKSIGVIQANPDKSKHLQTATMTILGHSVDINNLRTEVYHDDSRVPETKVGTAEEDALRRDFTVNSLFYNINKDKVEDLTGRGLSDLKEKILVTPLNPEKTFRDDPLRVLRAIRFSARFQFRLDDKIVAAAKLENIRSDLKTKVSRERFAQELNKVVGGVGSPTDAFQHLVDFNLQDVVFAEPSTPFLKAESVPDQKRSSSENPGEEMRGPCLQRMRLVERIIGQRAEEAEALSYSKLERQVAYYAGFLSSYHGYEVKVKKRRQSAVRWILVDRD
mmetsp:Transcript_41918/g.67406  ORF Transcript_41918/g.67406 Transcript_41918/m.67406 type:complete len:418 (+) Transcript_41918:85-1338(+)